jgi:UPF0755 protein
LKKSLKLIISIFLLFMVVAILSGAYLVFNYNQAPLAWADEYTLLVEPGMSISAIAHSLEKDGVISSYYVFRLRHEISGGQNTIPTGTYTLSPGMTIMEIYEKLVAGKQDMISLTIPEGWTISLIAQKLDDYGICTKSDFLTVTSDKELISELGLTSDSLEGYLFPDTYRFVYGESAENIARAMVANFFNQLNRIYPDWKDLTDTQLKDKIVMASIVEKEYRLAEEAPLIASVFYNRIDSPDFPLLQSCATVVYVITEIQGKSHPERLLYRDLEFASPYNTYYSGGLPPGAISNPGYTALNAAFHPAQTDYVFFVVKDSLQGSHNFSSNYSDFLDNKDSYLENFRSK